MRNVLSLFCVAIPVIFSLGCGASGPIEPPVIPVEGKVSFADGTVPQGEVATVYFEPISSEPGGFAKVASGRIGPDGSFKLTTFRPGDGAVPGDYRVLFVIHETYLGRESLIPEKYSQPDATPFEVSVLPSGSTKQEFVLEKP